MSTYPGELSMKVIEKNLCKYLLENKKDSSKVALYYGNTEYTYREIYYQVDTYGEYLRTRLSLGSKIIIHIKDQPQSIFLFLGAIKVGIHPIILNRNHNIENIMDTLEREKIKLVICDYNKNNDIRFIHIDNLTLNYEKTSAEFWAYETK